MTRLSLAGGNWLASDRGLEQEGTRTDPPRLDLVGARRSTSADPWYLRAAPRAAATVLRTTRPITVAPLVVPPAGGTAAQPLAAGQAGSPSGCRSRIAYSGMSRSSAALDARVLAARQATPLASLPPTSCPPLGRAASACQASLTLDHALRPLPIDRAGACRPCGPGQAAATTAQPGARSARAGPAVSRPSRPRGTAHLCPARCRADDQADPAPPSRRAVEQIAPAGRCWSARRRPRPLERRRSNEAHCGSVSRGGPAR
jgi:hypothetical protein